MERELKIDIVTLFPDFFDNVFNQSILNRACEAGFIRIDVHDLRQYTTDKHHQADDYRFGGGAGMLLKPKPCFKILHKLVQDRKPRPLVIFPTPHGSPFKQETADDFIREQHLVFLCGHYKGVDQRIVDRWVDRQYSVGNFVLSGGEIATLAIIDATVRMIPGVLGDLDSALTDSFRSNLLDGPHYTRPEEVEGLGVPGVLINGHHKNISHWRRITSELMTKYRRPDLNKTEQDKPTWKAGKK